ncbi:ribonucleotide-diphosphate reductase subunit beta [Micromonospora zamorensis]|uniref:ribonucleotide-diphosphate reductase subunit beta n=1 Tax=Micromonospora zamorensis TaxID=709883 RepID=UPI0018EC1A5F|nr:ribonucleotide-diphosphate reductase subunit beta [Micromonospora zamorensis]WSK49772.1 ribonucleotide-diphosphate reductase subunit beta [Micromonospora zamorensis]
MAEIRDLDFDDVMDYVHKDLKKLPDYLDLYRRYYRQRWDVYELDFSQDVVDWRTRMPQEEREAFAAIAAGFHHGERQVEVELPVFMLAGSEEAKLYLATQIEDEARHTVFFDRFYREVVGLPGDSIQDLLDSSFEYVSETFVGPFGLLAYLADDLRRDPEDPVRRVRYGTAYFLWTEGVLALTVMKVTLTYCRRKGYLPGYYTGFTASCRDEARHVQFGMRFLRDSVQENPRLLREIHDTLRAELAVNGAASRLVPLEPLGWSPPDVQQVMMRQLRMKLSDVGIGLPPDIEAMVSKIQPELAGG